MGGNKGALWFSIIASLVLLVAVSIVSGLIGEDIQQLIQKQPLTSIVLIFIGVLIGNGFFSASKLASISYDGHINKKGEIARLTTEVSEQCETIERLETENDNLHGEVDRLTAVVFFVDRGFDIPTQISAVSLREDRWHRQNNAS